MRVNFAREFDGSRTIKSTTFGRRSPFQYRIPRNRSKTSRSTASPSPTSRKKIPARNESQPKFPYNILYAEKKKKRENENRAPCDSRGSPRAARTAPTRRTRETTTTTFGSSSAARLARSRRVLRAEIRNTFQKVKEREKEFVISFVVSSTPYIIQRSPLVSHIQIFLSRP